MDPTSVTTETNTDNTSCLDTSTIQISTDNFVNCVRMTNGDPSTSDNTTFSVNPASGTGVISSRLKNLDWLESAGNGPRDPLYFKIRVKGGLTGVKDLSGNTMSSDNTTETGFLTAKSGGGSGCY